MYVWLGGIVLQMALAAVVVRREVWLEFPFFAIYFLSNFAIGCLLYLEMALFHAPRELYFYSFWSAQCLMMILGLGVVFEIFNRLFQPYPALKKETSITFRCAALLLVMTGAIVVFAQPYGETGLSPFLLATEEAVRLLEAGLVALLFLSAALFGLPWRPSEFGIALGMGAYAVTALVTTSLRVYFGASGDFALNLSIMLGFDYSLLIWIAYLSPQKTLISQNSINAMANDPL